MGNLVIIQVMMMVLTEQVHVYYLNKYDKTLSEDFAVEYESVDVTLNNQTRVLKNV